VLHTLRAHKGVDYAAPRGTPVKASGNGTVSFVGRKGGYGKAVILRHGSMYTTVYAHLSRYAKGVRTGRRVTQGQVIGYVGSTGLATGPHLHYEFRVRGVHKNPLKVKLPEAEPIDKQYIEDFLNKTRPMMVRLDTLSSTQLAAASQ
jgi:murein DD-endopeptidase MepM/ murein hydrolase activator NlpD